MYRLECNFSYLINRFHWKKNRVGEGGSSNVMDFYLFLSPTIEALHSMMSSALPDIDYLWLKVSKTVIFEILYAMQEKGRNQILNLKFCNPWSSHIKYKKKKGGWILFFLRFSSFIWENGHACSLVHRDAVRKLALTFTQYVKTRYAIILLMDDIHTFILGN